MVISCVVITNNDISAQDKELTLNEKIGIQNLKNHVLYKRKEVVAKHIKFPLERCSYFDLYVNDENDFINSFDQIFDSIQIQKFKDIQLGYIFISTFEYYSLQGGGYMGGFDDEGILKFTHIPLSESEEKLIQSLIEDEKKCLHPSISNYTQPICYLLVGEYRIRIDQMPDDRIRYSSWKKDADISTVPDLVILGGEIRGNRWGTDYVFINGEYEYHLADYLLSDVGPIFTVSKNGNTILEIDSDIQIKKF